MKRWIFCLGLLLAACPAIALAGTVDGGYWMRPIERPPAFGTPIAAAQPHGPVFTAPYGAEDLVGAKYLGPAQLNTMSVNVAMQMRDEVGLLRYAALASDPRSLYYRHFLTPQQVAEFFGAPPADYAKTIQYFWGQGLAVRWWAQREMIRVVGPQVLMERAFGTHFGWYRKHGVTFYAPISMPHFSVPLSVRGIGGMVAYRHFRRHLDVGGSFQSLQGFGSGFLLGLSPFQLAAAFDYTGAYNINGTCCKGDGITIGIIGTGPISAFDVPAYRSTFSSIAAATGTVNQINVTAVMACCYSTPLLTPPPVTAPGCSGPLPGCNPEDTEAQLDTEQTSSLAPNATVNFYLAYNPNECFAPGTCAPGAGSPQLGIGETDDELQQIANDDVADVVSGSYGIGELDFASPTNSLLTCPSGPTGCTGAEPAIFATIAAEGIAVFLSSGDTGAAGCQRDGSANAEALCVSYPSGDINVVSVGGTTSPIGSDGRFTGILSVWGVQTQTFGAGGGGFSSHILRPAYEPAGSVCATNARCDSTHRLQPDFSLNADLATGDTVIINCLGALPACGGTAQIGPVGGTSASAQDAAAMWALVLEACKQTASCATHGGGHPYRLGNPAPLLYGLSAAQRASTFFDVINGENAVPPLTSPDYSVLDPAFVAKPGWDGASGLGVPFARNLIKAIVGI